MQKHIEIFYLSNYMMLQQVYQNVEYQPIKYEWFQIKRNFPLPSCYKQKYSSVLLITPGEYISNYAGYSFYLDQELCLKNGKVPPHLFDEHGYNDLSSLGYSRASFHLDSIDLCPGGREDMCLYNILKSLYYFLAIIGGGR